MDLPDSNGETQRERLQHVVESTNGEIIPDELIVNTYAPYEFRGVVDVFFKLAALRTDRKPLQPSQVKDWLTMYGMNLSPFEHDALAAMDRAFLTELSKRDK